jgi:hypothetical protein
MQAWILTFNRPAALTRQILTWGQAGYDVHVFSNHPDVSLLNQEAYNLVCGDPTKHETKDNIHYNSLSYAESNSWCARSWNSIFIKAFIDKPDDEGVVFVQDDTDVHPVFPQHLKSRTGKFDFIWGPAGDQFFFMRKSVLRNVGWFDERYLGCYCGDADFLLRVWCHHQRVGDLDRLSIEEHHDWGWIHKPCGISDMIRRDIASKACDASYINQHEENEAKLPKKNVALEQSQRHFRNQWKFPGGNGINGIGPLINQTRITTIGGEYDFGEPYNLDWYPWYTEKHLQQRGKKENE